MTRAFKYFSIVFAVAMATLGVAYYYDHVTRKDFTNTETNGSSTLPPIAKVQESPKGLGRDGNKPLMRNQDADDMCSPIGTTGGSNYFSQTVTNTFDVRGTNEMRMMTLMTNALFKAGIKADLENKEQAATVRQLVMARVKSDWSTTPEHFKAAPDWAALQARTLKFKISKLLDTTNSLTIQRVLECPIGAEVPPMADYEVRTGDDAVWEEAQAMKK
jgi:regulation of enolase protein 1 (concanavalin A-like superfamily)